MSNLTPEQIAGVVAGLLALVIWFGGLKDARGWNRFQKSLREDRERRERGEPPVGDDPDRRNGPWG